ncbi:MAG: hypothetical protein ACWA41_03025 [Putridiphycobacter sp.]
MEFNHIEYKKKIYKIKQPLREFLKNNSRLTELPITYTDLLAFKQSIPVLDKDGHDTLWRSVIYDRHEMDRLYEGLIDIYEVLVFDGTQIPYLRVGSIDFCTFGNSKPFRVKIVNELNDNHDFYYVKRADASRIYGLELEDIFSPDKINYLVNKDTLIEDHVVGIPGDEFLERHKFNKIDNRMRLAKEFVKFNERCFTRLLGDMRAYNFVVEIIQDFDNVQYRLRPMDFDQQSFEGRKSIYLPQYYKDNIDLVNLASELMNGETVKQYQRQEKVAMKKRFLANKQKTKSLLRKLKSDNISTPEHVEKLKTDLYKHHKDARFLDCKKMGEILILQLENQLQVSIF